LSGCGAAGCPGRVGADAARQADWTARLDKAAALIAEGKALKEAATKALEEKTPACDQKFLVNACRNEARKEYLKASHEAQRLESEGKAIEREVKKQVADSKQRKAEEAPQQAAELEAREADTAAARQATQDKIEATQANKARQAEEGESARRPRPNACARSRKPMPASRPRKCAKPNGGRPKRLPGKQGLAPAGLSPAKRPPA
jgi:hypothetical protein